MRLIVAVVEAHSVRAHRGLRRGRKTDTGGDTIVAPTFGSAAILGGATLLVFGAF
jgi:hypothetical protein